jgi:selenocysteine-specific elongation factor
VTEAVRHIVLGTAGHIDHGKTALVKALTGIDCDRWEEEKQRGITIDIGFAYLDLPPPAPGQPSLHLAIIDVPGHRRFIRNMAAGAAGIDMLLLVIAADDGVMPQTTEHLHIARLLGVQGGVIALNKADMVDADLLELARADVEALVRGTFLERVEVVPVSALTGAGLDELRLALARAASALPERRFGELFRLPIDRSFSMKGAGTVVTGTVIAGEVGVDAEVELLPAQRKVRVRGIQVHGLPVKLARPGQRAALNLAGMEKDALRRGDMLAAPGSIVPTSVFDAEVLLLPGKFAPLRRGSEALLHAWTAEVGAKLQPLDVEAIAPGQSALAQLRLAAPLALAAGDRFILRHTSAEFTLGGGQVLDAHPMPHRRRRDEAAGKLAAMAGAGLEAGLAHEAGKAAYGIELAAAAKSLNTTAAAIEQAAQVLAPQGMQVHRDGRQAVLTLPENRARIAAQIERALAAYHEAHPLLRTGMSEHELAKAVHSRKVEVPGQLFGECLLALVAEGRAVAANGRFTLSDHEVKLTDKDRRAAELILKRMDDSLTPPQPEEFAVELPLERGRLKAVLEYMVEEGLLVLAPGGLHFTRDRAEEARALLSEHLEREETVTVSQFSQLVSSSRKYSIPLLQYFEQDGMLVRDGDVRRLARK